MPGQWGERNWDHAVEPVAWRVSEKYVCSVYGTVTGLAHVVGRLNCGGASCASVGLVDKHRHRHVLT